MAQARELAVSFEVDKEMKGQGGGAITHSKMSKSFIGEDDKTSMECASMLVASALGCGALTMPYMLHLSGSILGCCICVWASSGAWVGLNILMNASIKDKCDTYSKLLAFHTGPLAQPMLDFVLIMYGFGAMVSYFIFLGEFIPSLAQPYGGIPHPDWLPERTLVLLTAAAFVLPVMLQKDMALLAKLAPIAPISLVFVSCVIVGKAPGLYAERTAEGMVPETHKLSWDIFKASSICIFSYNGHLNVVNISTRLIDPTKERIMRITSGAVALEVVFYVLIALSGYLSFMGETHQIILQSYSTTDTLAVMCRSIYSCTIFVGICMNNRPTAQSVQDLILYFTRDNTDPVGASFRELTAPNLWLRPACCAATVTFQVTCAICIPQVAGVIGLLGASCATFMMFVVPGIVQFNRIRWGQETDLTSKVYFALMAFTTLVSSITFVVLCLEFAGVEL